MAEFIKAYPEAFLVVAGFLFTALFGAIVYFAKEAFGQFRSALSGLGKQLETGMERLGDDLKTIHRAVGQDITNLDRRLSHLEGEHAAIHQGGGYDRP